MWCEIEWWSPLTPSKKVKFWRLKPCAIMKVATRVVSVWKASTIRSSICRRCSSRVCGMPASGLNSSGSTTGFHSASVSAGFRLRSMRPSTSRTEVRNSSSLRRSAALPRARRVLASSSTWSMMLASSASCRRVFLLTPNSRSKTACGSISGSTLVLSERHETVLAYEIASPFSPPERGGSAPISSEGMPVLPPIRSATNWSSEVPMLGVLIRPAAFLCSGVPVRNADVAPTWPCAPVPRFEITLTWSRTGSSGSRIRDSL